MGLSPYRPISAIQYNVGPIIFTFNTVINSEFRSIELKGGYREFLPLVLTSPPTNRSDDAVIIPTHFVSDIINPRRHFPFTGKRDRKNVPVYIVIILRVNL